MRASFACVPRAPARRRSPLPCRNRSGRRRQAARPRPPTAPCSIRSCQSESAFAASTSSASGRKSRGSAREQLAEAGVVGRGGRVEAVRPFRIVGVAVIGARDRARPASARWPARSPRRARTCSSSGRSRAGATTTTCGARTNWSGTSAAPVERHLRLGRVVAAVGDADDRQPVGARRRRRSRARARGRSRAPRRVAAVTTAKWPSTCTLCGVTTTATRICSCEAAAELVHRRAQLRVGSTSPCGAIAAKSITPASRCARRAARGSALRRRRSRRARSAAVSVTCQRSTTVRPSQYCDAVSISTLHSSGSTSDGSITSATASASWIGEPSKP